MAEYIEREAAIDAIMKVYVGTAGYKARERVFEAEEAVHRLPVADCPFGVSKAAARVQLQRQHLIMDKNTYMQRHHQMVVAF